MTFQKIIAAVMQVLGKWSGALRAFIRHPIVYSRQQLQAFREAEPLGKVKKLAWAVVFVFLTVKAVEWVIAILAALIILGSLGISVPSGDSDMRQTLNANYRSRHGGVNPQNDNDMYRG